MTPPKLTIAIPCYNQASFLFECLNSLLAQTEPDWEAIVVDDCSESPGAIANVVRSYADPRMRCLRHEQNRGLAASRNTALRSSDAPFVLCLDADDFLHPEFLETTLARLEHEAGHHCCFTDIQLVGLSQEVWALGVRTPDDLAETQWIPGAGTVMRRNVWEAAGGYCESAQLRAGNEDWDFWITAMSRGLSAIHVPRPLYFYRKHGSSMSVTTLAQTEWKTRDFILQRHPAFFSIGNRRAVFLAGGLLRSARANRRAGNYGEAIRLAVSAVAERPAYLGKFGKTAIRRALRKGGTLMRRCVSRVRGGTAKRGPAVQDAAPPTSKDWEAAALGIHQHYGYLSHDYALLDKVIARTGARSVLEIGCGSGRLIPVYLKNNLDPIWAQDVSAEALQICKNRFRPQSQIRYFVGSIASIPEAANVDLIVTTRVLQLILDDSELSESLRGIAPRTRAFYINELAPHEDNAATHPHSRGRNYDPLLEQLGFQVDSRGTVTAECGSKQHWSLFVRRPAISAPTAPEPDSPVPVASIK